MEFLWGFNGGFRFGQFVAFQALLHIPQELWSLHSESRSQVLKYTSRVNANTSDCLPYELLFYPSFGPLQNIVAFSPSKPRILKGI